MPETTSVAVTHPADRLILSIERVASPVCVGLDPVLDRIPSAVRSADAVESIEQFTIRVLEAISSSVPCVKFQSACYERYGSRGRTALGSCIQRAVDLGLQVILDAKRGDIGISADHYAAAMFDDRGRGCADWATVNPYLGVETVRTFLRPGHGAFALVRTSNPESDQLQSLSLEDGRTVAEAVADLVVDLGSEFIGEMGYSSLGAVVGATKGTDHHRLRERMPRQILLVPGFGAQGGGLDDVLGLFNSDGRGAIITASRSVIYAGGHDDPGWAEAVATAAADLADELGRATGLRS